MSSNRDLRKYQSEASIQDAFSKLVSGKSGYKTVIEKKVIPPKCIKCGRGGDTDQKFCSQCGGRMVTPLTNCPGCTRMIEDNEKFCTECGHDLDAARASR